MKLKLKWKKESKGGYTARTTTPAKVLVSVGRVWVNKNIWASMVGDEKIQGAPRLKSLFLAQLDAEKRAATRSW